MNETIKMKKFPYTISDGIAILYIIIGLISFHIPNSNALNLAIFCIWLLAMYNDKTIHWSFFKNKTSLLLLLFLLYGFISALLYGNILLASKIFLGRIQVFSGAFLFYFYLNSKKKYMLHSITFASLAILFLCTLVSTIVYSINQDLPILLAQNSASYTLLPLGEGFALSYSNALLISFFVPIPFLKPKLPSYQKAFLCLYLLILLFAIYKSRSSLTFFAALLGLLSSILLYESKAYPSLGRAKAIILVLFCLLITFILLYNKELIGNLLMQFAESQNSKLLSRLYMVGEFLSGYGQEELSTGDGQRLALLISSLQTWLKNPIFGVNHLSGGEYSNLVAQSVGMHSQILDTLAQYGLLGAFLYFGAQWTQFLTIVKTSKKIPYVWIAIAILLQLVNPYRDFTNIHVQFFVIPSLYVLLEDIDLENLRDTSGFSIG